MDAFPKTPAPRRSICAQWRRYWVFVNASDSSEKTDVVSPRSDLHRLCAQILGVALHSAYSRVRQRFPQPGLRSKPALWWASTRLAQSAGFSNQGAWPPSTSCIMAPGILVIEGRALFGERNGSCRPQ